MKTAAFQISGMHCTSCAMLIDGDLEDTQGIKEASTNYAKSQTKVVFDPALINIEEIAGIIKKAGYDTRILRED
jgi:copper chaperone CopZ